MSVGKLASTPLPKERAFFMMKMYYFSFMNKLKFSQVACVCGLVESRRISYVNISNDALAPLKA